ncbi:DNA RNA non-specific endonuclease [Raphidocelis subcapitata]|uniref:DNA RNA non-specific endonuclease n=1 Tax=Raphidocelis subcapitata TaxID=307507 RepID=A0A2V0NS84_9CHLO|nr:DNA RNA non-specific endonuclease [Raphidocelis subcapitata]|eukprot:GBF90528.1 DNA RNA non-specific endonuclease [Raphidocelis subcapitata]
MDLRLRNIAVGFAVGAGLGVGGAIAYIKANGGAVPRPQQAWAMAGGRPVTQKDLEHPALKFGLPQTEQLRFFSGFVSCFDSATRNPKWVLEFISKDSLKGEGARDQSTFYEDTSIEERFRSKLADFQDSGYDRGHMAPAANHKGSQKAMDDTFALTNISPQVGAGFNRDYWARFEKFVKDVARRSDGVYVVTGPLYLPTPDADAATGRPGWRMQYPMIGKPPQLVAVPTHYFKVVLAENSSGANGGHTAALGAFVMPNAPIDPDTPLSAYAVPLDALECVAGARFFPGYVSERRRAAVDRAAVAWQEDGRRRMRILARAGLAQEQAVMLPERATVDAITASPQPTRSNNWGWGKKRDAAAAAAGGGGGADVVDVPVPKTSGGDGAIHVCELLACRLPPERWWENNGQGPSGGRKGRGGGGGGGSVDRGQSLKSRL